MVHDEVAPIPARYRACGGIVADFLRPQGETDYEHVYEYEETRELVQLVSDAAALVRDEGEAASVKVSGGPPP